MALTLLGTASANGDGSADVTVTHPGGIAENDVVFFAYCESSNDFDMQMTTSGYTELADVGTGSALQGNLGIYRKVMGATPDSTAVCDNGSPVGGNFSMAAAEHVYSGVDTTTPEDATTLASIATFSDTQPDSASITTVTANAIVLTIGFKNTTGATPGTVTAPSGYGNKVQDQNDGSREAQIGIAAKSVASPGAENPGAWSGFASYAFASVAQATVAVRPAAGGGTTPFGGVWRNRLMMVRFGR